MNITKILEEFDERFGESRYASSLRKFIRKSCEKLLKEMVEDYKYTGTSRALTQKELEHWYIIRDQNDKLEKLLK